MPAVTYRHTQVGWAIIATVGPAAAALAVATALGWLPGPVLALPAVLVLTLVLFATLTVTVDTADVILAFGPGLVRVRFRLADGRAARIGSDEPEMLAAAIRAAAGLQS